ncbi:MAG: antibiotic biosynthesis monooxygenase [Proteobacteria bacterium]|nr:antibiotic biosynthesis monooxygenase [Pseudomonadota bacterium]MDA1357898.1 antibiotic biosynthesis monooxygenase [Pseudomonadota bacterium]
MYIAMNRFRVTLGREGDFEEMWLNRDSHLAGVPGFIEFKLLKGPERQDHRLYSSHSVWASEVEFEAWTTSDAFRKAHQGAKSREGMYLGPPNFEGFEVLQKV